MAIATATALAIGGMAISAGTAGMSFAQAGKQNKLKRQAEDEAAQAMAAARKKLDVNFYEQLAINKEPYELAREASLVQGAEALQAGVEGEQRGAGAVAGRVQMAQNQQQGNIRSAMGQELAGLEKATVAEESKLRDQQVGLDLAEVTGAQLAARDAQQASAAAMTQGMQGVSSLGQQLISMAPLYNKDISGMKNSISGMNWTPEQFQQFGNVAQAGGLGAAGTGDFTNLDFNAIGKMNNSQFKQFAQSLTPQQSQMLFTNKQYTDSLNPFNPFR
jgi:hypothetical protein